MCLAALLSVLLYKPNKASHNETNNAPYCAVSEYKLSLSICDKSEGLRTIHGLWPNPPSLCSYCTQEQFNLNLLDPSTASLMESRWPSCPQYKKSNTDFWAHEWDKHGTCSGLSQRAYFDKALSLYDAYDLSTPCTQKTALGNSDDCVINICFDEAWRKTQCLPHSGEHSM